MEQPRSLTIIIPDESESWNALLKRMRQTQGELLVVLSGRDSELVHSKEIMHMFFEGAKILSNRITIATKQPAIIDTARRMGIRVIERTKEMRVFLDGHEKANEVLRVFSPHLWQQELKSTLQRMGVLSLPKLRIFFLLGLSAALFFFVILRLLPSAEIRVHPRQESVSQTVNIFLAMSGALSELPPRVRILPLRPITVKTRKSLTFDQVSKEFIGESATVPMTVVNLASEQYSFRRDTRFVNQAGMVFRINESVIIEPGSEKTVLATADNTDVYGAIIGERGNVPAGLKWEIPGLSTEERKFVYGENREDAVGGVTSYRTVLQGQDLEVARKQLEGDLLATAKQLVEEERQIMNAQSEEMQIDILNYAELTKTVFSGFVLPTQFLGEYVTSVPVEGGILYTELGYDAHSVLDLLRTETLAHVGEGRRVLLSTLSLENLVIHVIDYADDFSWIKLTVDLNATEEAILDPLSPNGALFAKNVRREVLGISKSDALRILKNMPEVDNVEISLWPPWSNSLPTIPAHIVIVQE